VSAFTKILKNPLQRMGIVMPSQTNGWQAVLSKMFYAKGAQVWYIDNNFVFRLTFRLRLVPL